MNKTLERKNVSTSSSYRQDKLRPQGTRRLTGLVFAALRVALTKMGLPGRHYIIMPQSLNFFTLLR